MNTAEIQSWERLQVLIIRKGYLEEIGPKLDLETENLESQRRG